MGLALIITFAVVIRLYNAFAFPSYSAEIAQHYLEIIKLLQGNLLLSGPLTSHLWLRLGAIPYYLFFPVFWATRFHPLTLFYFWTFADIAMIFMNYFVVKRLLNKNAGLLSTVLLSISPLHLVSNRVPGFYSFIIPLTYVLLLYLNKTVKKRSVPIWPIFLIVGFMINLHAAALLLVPVFIIVGIVLRKSSKKAIIQSTISFLIPNLPFILSDFMNRFDSTLHLMLWIPYKLLNLIMGKTLGLNRAITPDITIFTIIDFLKINFFPPNYPLVLGIFILSALVIYLFSKRHRPMIYIIYFWLFFGIVTLVIHKNPPFHYFVPILILPIIIASCILDELLKKNRIITSLIIFIAVAINMVFIFSPRYLFQKQSRDIFNIPYKTQERVARFIIQDVGGKKFILSRIGPFDTYANQFKENYEYLLWWMGNKPVEKSNLEYIIVEDKNRLQKNIIIKSIAEIDGILILKEHR